MAAVWLSEDTNRAAVTSCENKGPLLIQWRLRHLSFLKWLPREFSPFLKRLMNTKENTVALISDIFKQLFSRDQLFQCALDEANDGKIMTAPVLCLLLVPFETKQTYSFIIFFFCLSLSRSLAQKELGVFRLMMLQDFCFRSLSLKRHSLEKGPVSKERLTPFVSFQSTCLSYIN